jgi:hypothetical protein
MSTACVLERPERRGDDAGIDGRQVALHIDDGFDLAPGIERDQRLVDAVGAGFVIHARHHGLETMRAHRFGHALRVGRHHHPAKAGLGGAAGDMDDHRRAGDVGQRLARQAGRGHAGRDQDQRGHFASARRLERGQGKWQKVSLEAPL